MIRVRKLSCKKLAPELEKVLGKKFYGVRCKDFGTYEVTVYTTRKLNKKESDAAESIILEYGGTHVRRFFRIEVDKWMKELIPM